MEFLKKIGKIGGNANRDFRFAVGFDEGPTSKALQDGMKVRQQKQTNNGYDTIIMPILVGIDFHGSEGIFVAV